MNKETKRQHYVSRTYLQKFAFTQAVARILQVTYMYSASCRVFVFDVKDLEDKKISLLPFQTAAVKGWRFKRRVAFLLVFQNQKIKKMPL
ncbi:hypothetical protein Fleli_1847 [Bernardetia litoralis DSM 6794]|uniref:DUF4238 domain-containing protein n=1 Tax=Bernardetia litoralis (strain ATCC 23117 / DSM 6794 / NBRC 15988 / NCIMB 1366 / Fx l1 / Sio-4) TaxID=880071 RepID=I4AJW0_BERLS|nr:hypothetical protein [Bernardetia litoralis]AFM04245.1 hypothetical protein Fleli_1847 [Bernardetia litoralis DSM 6794]